MRFTLSLFLLVGILCCCSTQKENTYEENLAICTKKLNHFPIGIDTTSLEGEEVKIQFQEQIRECMKGSLAPALTVKTYRGDSISIKPEQRKATVLFFWFAIRKAPINFRKSDSVTFAAMNALYHKYKHRVNFLGIPFNDSLTTQQYLQEHPLDFPQAHDKRVTARYDALAQGVSPYVVFINIRGRVAKVSAGSSTRKELIMSKYSSILQACIEDKPYTD